MFIKLSADMAYFPSWGGAGGHHQLFPDSIKSTVLSPPVLISQSSNGVTGTVLVWGDPEQSTGHRSHESPSTENKPEQLNTVCFAYGGGLKPLSSHSIIQRRTSRNMKAVCTILNYTLPHLLHSMERLHWAQFDSLCLNWTRSTSTVCKKEFRTAERDRINWPEK